MFSPEWGVGCSVAGFRGHTMLKVALLSAVAVLSPSLLLAKEEWKPETAQAALDLLQKARKAISPLGRLEVECLRSVVNDAFGTDTRSRVRLYYDQSAGFLFECRPVDCTQIQPSRRTQHGEICSIRTTRPETWLMTTTACTVINPDRRTYESVPLPPRESWVGCLLLNPLQIMPSWFEPTVDWTDLQSRLSVEFAESTSKEFRIQVLPLQELRNWQLFGDERLTCRQTVVIDRQTLLPKRLSIAQQDGEVTFLYTRIDPHPPQRALKVDLTGYRDETRITPPAAATEASSAWNTTTLEVGARILLWLLF
jgi:hypothetical protein